MDQREFGRDKQRLSVVSKGNKKAAL